MSADSNDLLYSVLNSMNSDEEANNSISAADGSIDVSDFTKEEMEQMFAAIDKGVDSRISVLTKIGEKAKSSGLVAMDTFGYNLSKTNQALLKSEILSGSISNSMMESLRKAYGGIAILSCYSQLEYNNNKEKPLYKKICSMSEEEFLQVIDALINTESVLAEEDKLRKNPRDIYLAVADPVSICKHFYNNEEIQSIIQAIIETPTAKEMEKKASAAKQVPSATMPVSAPAAPAPTPKAKVNLSMEVSYVQEFLRLVEEFTSVKSDVEDTTAFSSLERALTRTQKLYQHTSAEELHLDDVSQDLSDVLRSYSDYQSSLLQECSLSTIQVQRCSIGNQFVRLYRNLEKKVYDPTTNYTDLLATKILQAKLIVSILEGNDTEEGKSVLLNATLFNEKVDTLRENSAYTRYITSDAFRNDYQGKGLEQLYALDYGVLLQTLEPHLVEFFS